MSAYRDAAVLQVLHEHADPATGSLTLTDAELGALTQYSARSICYALRALRLAGAIRSTLHGDFGTKRVIHTVELDR